VLNGSLKSSVRAAADPSGEAGNNALITPVQDCVYPTGLPRDAGISVVGPLGRYEAVRTAPRECRPADFQVVNDPVV
jgi:hypothetical protein